MILRYREVSMLILANSDLVEDVESIYGFLSSSTRCCVYSMCLEKEACKRRGLEASTCMMFCDNRHDLEPVLKMTKIVCSMRF